MATLDSGRMGSLSARSTRNETVAAQVPWASRRCGRRPRSTPPPCTFDPHVVMSLTLGGRWLHPRGEGFTMVSFAQLLTVQPPTWTVARRTWNTEGALVVVAVLATVLAVAGCGPSGGGDSPNTSTSATAKDVPRGFDPCTGVPDSVLASEKLKPTGRDDADSPDGVMWRGCGWVVRGGDSYTASIRTTNLTVSMIRARNFTDTREFTIAGRQAISTRQFEGPHVMEVCAVNVEMRDGSLEVNLTNPPSAKETGHLDSCQLARTLAEKVMPSVPAGA
ncbi:DUF3558 domain-containing protein [Nocardia sp. NPDC050175]|uniref:DUF3558 domain-containing protein n=1 Tax=Nocardia sp. NPDC050175 TaxID=3364317 RepID=UPI00378BB43E